MIQDIAPHKFFNSYSNESPAQDSLIIYFEEQSVLITRENDKIKFPSFSEWKEQNTEFIYLFSIDEISYFLAHTTSKVLLPGYFMENIKLFRTAHPKYTSFAGITAYQLNNWYQAHKFCGKCGDKMIRDTKERMLYCENCHHMEYPKIAPAVIVAVTNGDKLLMSRYANRTFKRYALIAGFTEIGETVEETVTREVMEEVGLRVKNIRYYKSQPWSFSDTLLIGFFAELDGDETIKIDEEELAEAIWMPRREIQAEPDNLSLTNEMILKFKNADGEVENE
jgi:NAD+ diphosphatase